MTYFLSIVHSREAYEYLCALQNSSIFWPELQPLTSISSLAEAIQAILIYSQSAEELLKRRKVYREIIFKYLAVQGIAVPPSSEKHQLIACVRQNRLIDKPYKTTLHLVLFHLTLGGHKSQDDVHNLGREFCQWFFELLNSQHPLGVKSEEAWGPQHFWENAKMKFCYNTVEKNVEEYNGAEMVSLRLLSLVKEEYLLFNPNLTADGLKCAMSRHGLVLVAVAGTVHRGNICLGIFEQIFGLIRCPIRGNTWKIKIVDLKIVGQNALEPGMQIEKPSIKYEPNQLEDAFKIERLMVGEKPIQHLTVLS
uniref:Chromosome 3 open reading frame 38 n=1 Tax=Pavo cristatus TaxID=9049 RepID=A0A8C9FCI9_PAVCR